MSQQHFSRKAYKAKFGAEAPDVEWKRRQEQSTRDRTQCISDPEATERVESSLPTAGVLPLSGDPAQTNPILPEPGKFPGLKSAARPKPVKLAPQSTERRLGRQYSGPRRGDRSGRYPVDERGYTDTKGAAKYLCVSVSKLNKDRHYGVGAEAIFWGRSVRYSYAALDVEAAKNRSVLAPQG